MVRYLLFSTACRISTTAILYSKNSILVVVAVDWNPGSLSVPGLTKDGCQLTPLGPTSFSKFVGHRFLHEQELKNYVVATMVGVVSCL